MSDNLRDRFGEKLGEIARLWRVQMNRRLQSRGLSFAQWLALRALAQKGDGTVQKDLAEAIGIEGSTLVGLLDRLAKAGLIERREDVRDRRFKRVHLSAKAQALIPELQEIHRGLRYELFDGISDDELAVCLQVFEHVTAKAETLDEHHAAAAATALVGR